MIEIKDLLQQMQGIENRIRDLLDREQMKVEDIPDDEISTSERACAILNNIDLLDAALLGVRQATYALQDYEEVGE